MKKRILSGMRPTGKLHIGHYVGALENWVALQEDYDNYHLVADYHVLTTDPANSNIYNNTIDMVIDWISAGIDPVRSPIFRQSQIKEHTELFLIFSMLITTARLERNPTLKDQVRDLNIDSINFGHLGYTVLQAADILLYKGNLVPVGEDQVPHVEITREIARKFNQLYGEVFLEPDAKLTKFARLVGLDGNTKMSKSLNNTILLSDSKDEIQQKLRKAITDPQKIRKGDTGRPAVCLVNSYHKKFNPTETEEIDKNCSSGALGCVDCKSKCTVAIDNYIGPIREKRLYFENHKDEILAIMKDGENRAKAIAQKTMGEVREAMKLGQLS
jgi:tryptophanyl-tRNA synthetase